MGSYIRNPLINKMRAILTAVVVSSLLVGVTYASCVTANAAQVAACLGRPRTDNSFCRECGNALFEYYRECSQRDDLESLLGGMFG